MSDSEFIRPFPALTPAQRYHLEVYGSVVVEQDLTEHLLEAMPRLKRALLSAPDPAKARVRNCRLHFAHILEADPAIGSAPRMALAAAPPRHAGRLVSVCWP